MCVLYNNRAKTSQGKSNFAFKNVSVWCSTKSKIPPGFVKENNPQSLLWLFSEESAFILLKDAYLALSAKLLTLCTAVLQGSIL